MNWLEPVKLNEAAAAVQAAWPGARPRFGMILGSGWGEAVAGFSVLDSLPYEGIPFLGPTSVLGHRGQLLLAECSGAQLFIFQGRRHVYEGAGWMPVVLPAWILKQFGATALLLTNAAGGIRDDLQPGTLMVVEDHLNWMGGSPLVGPAQPQFGPRFPDQTRVYSRRLCHLLRGAGADASGVYVATAGPSFETPAEIRAFRALGADAVGMSSVPEAIFANALGLEVAALSCISNRAAGLGHERLTAEDVVEVAERALPRMRCVLERFAEEVVRLDVVKECKKADDE